MSRWPGRLITRNPVTPGGSAPTASAPGIWTLPEMAYWKRQGLWPDASADAYWGYVSYLMASSSLSNANNNMFVDSGSAFNPISRNGNATQGAFTPYGTLWSNYFDGSGDYLTVPYSTAFDLSGSSWTMEAWFYSGSFASAQTIISKDTYGSNYDWGISIPNSTTIVVYTAGTASNLTATVPTMTPNTWYHVAVVRNSGVNSIYLNGVSYASNSMSFTNNSQSFVTIGCSGWNSPNSFFPGYISNLRIVKGTAVYTANFTPPTAPLTAVTNTSLLTCQSNRFRDASGNAIAVTRNGDVTVTPFSPFVLNSPGAVYNQSDISYWSGYFDGSGDYLTAPTNAAYDISGGDYTIEAWVNFSALPAANNSGNRVAGVGIYSSGFGGGWEVALDLTQNLVSIGQPGSANLTSASYTFAIGQWYHVAVCRASGTNRIFVNGTSLTLTANTFPNNATGSAQLRIAAGLFSAGYEHYLPGYISAFRIVKGAGLYSSNFTPPTAPLTAVSGTSVLTCQSAAFTDNSANNAVITPNGNSTVTGNNPYQIGYYGNYFDGNGDGLSISSYSSSALAFGTSDFTIEFWAFATTAPNNNWTPFFTMGTSSAGQEIRIAQNINGGGFGWLYPDNSNTGSVYAGYGAMTTNTWHHIAMTRSGSTMRLFLDGAVVATGTGVSFNFTNTTLLQIGLPQPAYADGAFTGYLSNLRIVKGTAVYTAAFTPPTAPLTAISGTGLLTCQANRLIDSSANAFALTKAGDTSVVSFDPFYTSTIASNGGSGFFDGASDYLTVPANPAFSLGSSDFTLECWVYNREVSRNIGYAGVWSTSYILYREATVYRFYYFGPGGSPLTSSIPAVANAWTHLAVVRSGSTLTFYVNGAVGATANVGTTAFNNGSTLPFYIATNQDGPSTYGFDGYMAGLRLVKGTAIYTSAFTPPTTPPTAVSGTSILCNFANAGVYDAAMQNDFETLGSTQVSTTQAKYGTTSIAFNGSTDSLSTPNKPSHNFGTGDFTIEGWLYPTTTNAQATAASNYNGPSDGWSIRLGSTGLVFGWGDTAILVGSSTVAQNTWSHVAITRSGTTARMFINGTQVASATDSTNFTTTGTLYLGRLREATAGFLWQGYIDDFRITRGYARYTANFTPPTAALPIY